MKAILRICSGPRKGEKIKLTDACVVQIGRDPQCEICLPERNASRVHAMLYWDGTQVEIRDLNSTNGTFVNGVKKSHDFLSLLDTFMIGSSVFRIEDRAGASTFGGSLHASAW